MSATSTPCLVSVIIVTYNDGDWLPRCLESLKAQTIFDQMEVILADNASNNGTDLKAQALLAGWTNGRFIQNGGNLGFGAGNNRGAAIARGEFLFFTNSDTWFEPDCLENLYRTVTTANADGGSARTMNYAGDKLLTLGCDGFDLFVNPVVFGEHRIPSRIFCIAGFLFVRKNAFERIGRFDEAVFMYEEELDISWRLLIAGHQLVAVPGARVYHCVDGGSKRVGGIAEAEFRVNARRRFLANRNHLYVIAKNANSFLLLLLLPAAGLILAEGILMALLARSWSVLREGYLKSLAEFCRLRPQVRRERSRLAKVRKHGDSWLLRFVSFKFGRWQQLGELWEKRFPKPE